MSWIKLHREVLDSQVFAHPITFKLWCWLLIKANHNNRTIPLKVGIGFTEVDLKRGQFIFGRHKAEDALGIDGSTIYKHLQKLQEWGNIIIESNNQFSIVTICKYDEYQTIYGEEEQPSNSRVTTEEQQSNSRVTQTRTLKNDKNVKNDKKLTPPSLLEIKEYCIERNNKVSPEKFFDYYTINGWKVGRNSMKDWLAAVRNWEKSSYDKPATHNKDNTLASAYDLLTQKL